MLPWRRKETQMEEKGSCSCEQFLRSGMRSCRNQSCRGHQSRSSRRRRRQFSPPLLEEGSIEEEPVLQGPPESEQSEKEEPVQSPLLEEGSIEEEPEQREGGEELSEPVLQESSESGQSEEEGPDQSPEQLRRTTRTTAGIHSNPFDLQVCGEADPFSYKHKLGQILRRSMSLFSLSM
ncbi:unnamed protein product [Boreogadus saida]